MIKDFNMNNIRVICNGIKNYTVYYTDGNTEYLVGHFTTKNKNILLPEVKRWLYNKLKLEGAACYGKICQT